MLCRRRSLGGSAVQHAGTRSPSPLQKCHFRPSLGWMQPHFLQQQVSPQPRAGRLSEGHRSCTGCEEQPAPHRGRRLPWRDLPAAQPTAVGPGDTVLWVLHPASALRQLKNLQPCSVPRRTASPCHGAGLHGIAPLRRGAGKPQVGAQHQDGGAGCSGAPGWWPRVPSPV